MATMVHESNHIVSTEQGHMVNLLSCDSGSSVIDYREETYGTPNVDELVRCQ